MSEQTKIDPNVQAEQIRRTLDREPAPGEVAAKVLRLEVIIGALTKQPVEDLYAQFAPKPAAPVAPAGPAAPQVLAQQAQAQAAAPAPAATPAPTLTVVPATA